jgi:predicted small lipoprotein YifL
MNRISLIIFSLFLIMVLSCCGCGKKGPPMLPKGHSSVSISENEGEEHLGFSDFDGNQPGL